MTAMFTAAAGGTLSFPGGFVWGAATAAYQIEGAAGEDGRGTSIWDVFTHTPGRVAGGHTGDVACDHYHRYRDDVRLMRELGLGAYRFSVAWPRIQPTGSGPVNAAGLDFYDRLVDELLAADVSPYVTLYHWDLPQPLEDRGGWTERDTAHRFADYARIVHDRLGDRVGTWITVNEPWVVSVLGYGIGAHAPGRASWRDAFQASHHLLLAHGLGARALRDAGAREIALTLNLAPVTTPGRLDDPDAALSAEDAAAVDLVDCLINRQFLDPVLRGEYPAAVLDVVERAAGLGHIRDGDLETVNQPLDLLGVNYYNPCVVSAEPGEPANPAYPGTEGIRFGDAYAPKTAMGWPIVPTGLTRLLVRLSRDYPQVGLLVTENGAAFEDTVSGEHVHDADRIAFLEGHLRAAHTAVDAGADLRGYLVWSLLDNFEWAEGYGKRFGIVHIDFDTQRRLPKDSALWYRDVIRNNGLRAGRARRPTLEEVAARAGVSRSTVSRVINGEAAVSPEFRAIVMDAVTELGYVPNSAARSLVTRRTESIALIVPDGARAGDPLFATAVDAAGRELERAGKRVTLMFAGSPADRNRVERHLAAGHVDGALLLPARGSDPLPGALAGTGVPVVSLGRPPAAVALPYAGTDDAGGAAAAVGHLLGRGRRRIATIRGPVDLAAARDRFDGYRNALRDAAGRSADAVGDLGRASGAAAMRELLAADPSLDAVFVAGDLMAVGALHALREAGLRVPEDVAVVGFGDEEDAAYAVPPLTTVRVPWSDQVLAAVRLLLRQIGGGPSSSVILPTELVVRSSS
ncbi:GH1 family beta-glucosidase [Streptosporangium sandarakinum]